MLENLESAEENYEYHILKQFKEELTSILHEEIKNSKSPKKPQVLRDLRSFRRHFQLHDEEEDDRLKENIRKYWLESSDESELISTFLKDFNFDDHKV